MRFLYDLRLQLLGLFFLITLPVFAQKLAPAPATLFCDAPTLTPAERRALEAEAALAFQLKKASMGKARMAGVISYVPIRPHILRRTDGTGARFTLRQINNIIALANSRYISEGIQFFFSGTAPNYIDDTDLFTNYTGVTSRPFLDDNNATDAMNQYFVDDFAHTRAGGYASFPSNNLSSTESCIRYTGNETFLGSLIAHEFGHNFNLIHTFEATNPREKIDGSNCATAGDRVCDTPADPYKWPEFPGASETCVSGCPLGFSCDFTEAGTGLRYNPLTNNIMSYYPSTCKSEFTPGQFSRVQAALALRQTHTAYSLTALSTNVTPVSNLSATVVNARVVLSWTDNANNEMGYFIERSTISATDGFVPIGGVATDAASFTDTQPPSLVTAYYRIRPSNSTGSVSAVVSIPLGICLPFYATGCGPNFVGIGSFTVNAQALSQTSSCLAGSYSQFTAVTPTVEAGNNYPFTVAPINRWNGIRYSIWADFNQNGSFTDPGELLFQSPSSTTANVSGVLSIPASASMGTTRLRVVSRFGSTSPADPCGSYGEGEVEDYQLNVTPNLNLSPTVQGLAASSATICAGGVTTFTATLGNVSGLYTFTLTNGSGLVSGTASGTAFSQLFTTSGTGGASPPGQTVTLTVGAGGNTGWGSTVLNVGAIPTVVITFPGSASVQTTNGVALVTVPPSAGLSYQLTGGVLYSRYVLVDRINGYVLRKYMQTTDGLFPIDQYGSYTIRVVGANGCERTVEGEIRPH